ncbi:YraN family protein [Occultella glacieicola]|uniref:UPF0102 protein EXU48_23645 n=1 Tax=Occultella glacieicola TaxID=2518684 RepID=A0ABY2DYV0_9MICO|nr:YraN family protein [Occultella glacieicola]TDE88281.1 YraN family protein [Occultella glacieicola]
MVAMLAKDEVGRSGELLARRWLEREGFEVLAANWRCPAGEIDIVARDGDDVVIVEVKTRSSLRFGHPAEAVDRAKLARLRRLAGLWLAEHPTRCAGLRIDVVAIWHPAGQQPRLEHLRGVS